MHLTQLIIEDQAISLNQLWVLGAEIEQEDGTNIPVIPTDIGIPIEFDPIRDRSRIIIRSEFWISQLLTEFATMDFPSDLNWLIVTARFLRLQGERELIRRIEVVLTVLEEPTLYMDLPDNRSDSFAYLWLRDFLTNYNDKPWIIYGGKGKRQLIWELEEDNKYLAQKYFSNNLTELADQSILKDALIPISEKESKKVLMKQMLARGFKNLWRGGGSKAFMELVMASKGCFADAMSNCKDLVFTKFNKEANIKLKNLVQKVSKVQKVLKTLEVRKVTQGILKNKYFTAYIGAGLGLTIWDSYEAGKILVNPDRTDKENRDAIATFSFIGGELVSTGVLVAFSATPAVGILVGVSWTVGSFTYSGFSLLYDHRNANLSDLERYNIFSRGFWQQDIHPRIQEYLNHKESLDELAKVYYSILKEKPHICFIASSIGEYNTKLFSFKEFVTEKYGALRAEAVLPRVYYKHEDTGFHEVAPAIDPTPYEKEHKDYLLDNMILPAPINIVLKKNELRKISRLTPELPSSDAKLLCAPNFREKEPESTANRIVREWSCDNSFIITLSSSQIEPVPNECTGVFDLSLASTGQIRFEKKVDFKSEFQLGNNSTISIAAPRNNSPNSKFIIPAEGFSGTLIGDPNYGNLSDTVSSIDVFQVKEKYKVELYNQTMYIRETKTGRTISKAEFHHIQFFLGHSGQDIIDCEKTNIHDVAARGGTADAPDYLIECKQALLYSHTKTQNTKSDPFFYIQPNSTNIDIFLSLSNENKQTTIIVLPESIETFLKNYSFQFNIEEDTLTIKKVDNNIYLLSIANFIQSNSKIQFIDVNKVTIFPHFIVEIQSNEGEVESIANNFVYSMQVPDRASALAQHKMIVDNNLDKQILGQFYYSDSKFSDKHQAILGTHGDDLIIIDDLASIDYVVGNEGVDIYKLIITKKKRILG